jgi:hypothetical protein
MSAAVTVRREGDAMDYAEMNLGSWASYLIRFKNLVRPVGTDPLGEPEGTVESVRSDDSAQILVTTISGLLPDLVFEGYSDWFDYSDEWVLRNLGHVLTAQEEDQILSALDQGTPDALDGVLNYISGQLDAWRDAARGQFADASGETGTLEGAANTENWTASRTPGTYYYTYVGDRYLYSDLSSAPQSEWETLPVREQMAADNAQPWGDTGWFWTPTGEPDLYGGAFVYAAGKDGPWVTEEQAQAALANQAADPEAVAAVETLVEDAAWKETIEAGVTASSAPSASSDSREPTPDPSPTDLADQIIAAFAHDPSALARLSDADIDAMAQQAARALLSSTA